jgi:hypothetical protein
MKKKSTAKTKKINKKSVTKTTLASIKIDVPSEFSEEALRETLNKVYDENIPAIKVTKVADIKDEVAPVTEEPNDAFDEKTKKEFMEKYLDNFVRQRVGKSYYQLAVYDFKNDKIVFTSLNTDDVIEVLVNQRIKESEERHIQRQAYDDALKNTGINQRESQ